jgi:bicarbonate transport system ATP-binding protein
LKGALKIFFNRLSIPFDRPRDRDSLLHDQRYGELRNRALEFLYERQGG